MKKKTGFVILLLSIFGLTTGFIAISKKWNGIFPIVNYKVNLSGLGIDNTTMLSALQKIQASVNLWSLSNLDNTVFATNAVDPDCTADACTFIWSCGDEILHFDIQINTLTNKWNFTGTPDPNSLNAVHVLGKSFSAFVTGLDKDD